MTVEDDEEGIATMRIDWRPNPLETVVELHVPRWKEEAHRAHDWLLEHRTRLGQGQPPGAQDKNT